RTSNPVLSNKAFERVGYAPEGAEMTLTGTVNKTGLLLVLAIVPAAWVWGQAFSWGGVSPALIFGSMIGALIVAFVTIFKQEWSPYTAPAYAVLEGVVLGGISAMLEARYPGIVLQAVVLTFAVLACMLVAYRTGMIRATDRFRRGVVAATGAVFLTYMLSFVLSFFGMSVPFINGGGFFGIVISLVIVVIAALNLVLDFDFIERGVDAGAPKYMEWYAAFGLMVTLVWLYMEILRLLSKVNRR
ncbi:MAG TPA: Bax inhibitor-1/YccA family protein, partial [Rhodothermales bacterium]|nr:Bax inhibitor-1/YccA family protein [Rhodothermales bacterium]